MVTTRMTSSRQPRMAWNIGCLFLACLARPSDAWLLSARICRHWTMKCRSPANTPASFSSTLPTYLRCHAPVGQEALNASGRGGGEHGLKARHNMAWPHSLSRRKSSSIIYRSSSPSHHTRVASCRGARAALSMDSMGCRSSGV